MHPAILSVIIQLSFAWAASPLPSHTAVPDLTSPVVAASPRPAPQTTRRPLQEALAESYACLMAQADGTPVDSRLLRFSTVIKKFGDLRKDLCEPLTMDRVCKKAAAECRLLGNESCWALNQRAQSARMESVSHRKLVLENTFSFFDSTQKNSDFLKTCCGHNPDCQSKILKLELVFVQGLPKDQQYAYYFTTTDGNGEFTKHRIELSEAILLNSLSAANIERVLLHELGHACDISRHAGHKYMTKKFKGCASDEEFRNLETYFSKEVAKCIRDDLARPMAAFEKASGQRVCLADWLHEAFAEAFQYQNAKDIQSFSWDCSATPPDLMHPPPAVPMNCMLKHDPKLRRNLCGEPGAK